MKDKRVGDKGPSKDVQLTLAASAAAVKELVQTLSHSENHVVQLPSSGSAQIDSPQVGLLHLQAARRELSQLVEDGTLSSQVTDLLFSQSGFAPIEGLLVDYKRDVPSDTASMCKLIRHVAAFHNTYGGYLILGAEEVKKDTQIIPVHSQITSIDTKHLRDLTREYLGTPVEVQATKLPITYLGKGFEIQIVHVPKRTKSDPAVFRRNGPEDEKGKPLFTRDQVYFRDGDNSVPAVAPRHWQLVFSSRSNPYLLTAELGTASTAVWSNLPDRGLICQEFIGREKTIAKLYEWLADDFSCVRVLAGEGGLGKTSIAYEFASEVARLGLGGVETVAWLSAKRMQFRALENRYENLSVTHFSDSREMFVELAHHVGGASAADMKDTPDAQVPRLLRELIRDLRIFAVIDDLDSLELDEQKRCIEVCQQLSGAGSRFLFTTRKNATASSTTAIELHGLDETDYPSLIESWRTRLELKEFTQKEVSRLRDATLGSPLYTESLLRLIRSGLTTNDAIAKWKGNLGIEVRNAALQREVLQLTTESRKVLVTVAIFGECSFAEVKQATSYSDHTLLDCFNELQSLFLVSAPSIAQQARFGISTTTRELVLSLGAELLPGFVAYRKTSESNRYKIKGVKVDLDSVGAAINQAIALLAARDPEQTKLALQTIDEVNARLGGKNADLLSTRGRILTKMGPSKNFEASKAFRQAFDAGQRNMPFFRLWYETELLIDHQDSAVDVSTYAIEASSGPKFEWLLRRAHARVVSAVSQDRKGDIEHARSQLVAAAQDLAQCRASNPEVEWDIQWKEYLYNTHDSLWQIDTRTATNVPAWITALDGQLEAIERADMRIDVFERVAIALTSMHQILASKREQMSQREVNLMQQKARECIAAFKRAPANLRTMRLYLRTQRMIEDVGSQLNR
jgi:hypothetical protein